MIDAAAAEPNDAGHDPNVTAPFDQPPWPPEVYFMLFRFGFDPFVLYTNQYAVFADNVADTGNVFHEFPTNDPVADCANNTPGEPPTSE